MFTGIIEKSVSVISVTEGPMFWRLTLASPWTDLRDGESIAVNGACLSVADQQPGTVGFDVVLETLRRTNLGMISEGDQVHVERSLKIGDRIDGHFVQGHVDGTALLVGQTSVGKEWRFTIECPDALVKFITPKGSVTLDGVSLTVASIDGNRFDVALIPTTLRLTTFSKRENGWRFNLEADMINKAVVSYLERTRQ